MTTGPEPPAKSAEPADPSAETLARYARSLLHEYRAEYDGAIRESLAAVEASPDDERLNARAATLLLRQGRAAEAVELIDRWLARDPTDPRRVLWRARVLRAAERTDEALEAYERACAMRPTDAEPLLEAVLLRLSREDRDGAARMLERGLDSARPVSLVVRAVQEYAAWVQARDPTGAKERIVAWLGRVERRYDLDAPVCLAAGQLYQALGEAEAALRLFRRASEMDPRDERAPLGAALALSAAGREEEAVAVLQQALERVRKPLPLLRLVAGLRMRAAERAGDIERARAEYEAAARALQRALSAVPDQAPVRRAVVELLLLAGRPEEALGELRELGDLALWAVRDFVRRWRTRLAGAEALSQLQALARERPLDSRLQTLIGEWHLVRGEPALAAESFRRALAGDAPDPAQAVRLAAALAFEEPSAALPVLEEAERRWPEVLALREARAQLHLFFEEPDRARQVYAELEDHLRTVGAAADAGFWVRSALAHVRAGDEIAAAARLRQATELEALAIEEFVRLAADPERPAEEISCARRVLQALGDERSDVFLAMFRGLFEFFAKNYAEAVAAFDRAVERVRQDGGDADLLTPDFHFWHGAALERAGDIERAAQQLLLCIERDPNHHRALNYLAYTWADRNLELERALEFIERALRHEPDNGAYVDTRGWIYYRMGRYDEALRDLQRALELEPDEAEILSHLGDVLAVLGRADEALDHWKRAFVRDPESEAVRERLRERGIDLAPLEEEALRYREQKRRERRWRWLIGDYEATPPAEEPSWNWPDTPEPGEEQEEETVPAPDAPLEWP